MTLSLTRLPHRNPVSSGLALAFVQIGHSMTRFYSNSGVKINELLSFIAFNALNAYHFLKMILQHKSDSQHSQTI